MKVFDTELWYFEAFNILAIFMSMLFLFGFLKSQPAYFVTAKLFVKSFLAALFIYRFGYLKKKVLSKFDRHACYVAGSYILLSTFADTVQSFKLIIENKIKSSFIK